MIILSFNCELYHHGIKGMRWGVRRFQNSDGSLTSAGKRRYGTEGQYEEQRRINNRMLSVVLPTFKNRLVDFNNSLTTSMIGPGKSDRAVNDRMMEKIRPGFTKKNALLDFNKKVSSQENLHDYYKKAHERKNVKTMSDNELREVLNRFDMKKRYESINTNTVNNGKKYASKVLNSAATVAAVTGTALNIYNNLEKPGNIVKK